MSIRVWARRVAFAGLALALAGAAAFAFLQAGKVDDRLSRETRRSAEHAAEAVASRLTTEDLDGPMGDTRAETISSFVEGRLLDPSKSVTVWNADGVAVFAADPTLIGTQDRRLRSRISRALSNGTQTETTDGSVHTFVAVAVGEGDGTPVVAEVIRPDEASSAGRPWIYASIAAGLLAFLALVAAVRTSSAPSRGSAGFSGGNDLRRERKNLLQGQKTLERSQAEGATLKGELERGADELAETKEALAAKESSIGEVDARVRAAEEQAARAEAELDAGATVREEAARLIEAELRPARSEVAAIERDHDRAQRQLESGPTAEAELELIRGSTSETEANLARLEAETERVRGELAQAETRATDAETRLAEADARAEHAEEAAREAQARADEAAARADEALAGPSGSPTQRSAELEAELERSKTQASELEAEVEARDARGAELAAEVSRAEARAEAAEARAMELSGRIEEEGARMIELAERAERAEGLVTELAARAERAEVRADEMTERAVAAEVAAAQLDENPELEAARAEAEDLMAKLTVVTAELDAVRADDADASEVSSVQEELANLRHELEEAMTSVGALARRNDELEEQVASRAAKAEAEAADARARLLETQGSLARLQETAERGDDGGPVEREAPSMTPSAATEVADALSVDAKRSLSAIFGLARTLSTRQVSKDDERLLHQLMTQAKRMEHAIGDIFDADRLTRGEPVLEWRSTEIDTLVRRVVREFPFAQDRDLDVSVETATVMVDRARVERLVDDLLTSAVARSETGDHIGLVLERAPDGVLISVEGGTPLNGDESAGAASAFLAKLHGGWTKAERLPDGTGVVRAFLPNGRTAGTTDEAETAAALG